LFQRESPPELLSQVLAARGALTVLAAPLGTALGGPLTVWLGAQHTLLTSAAATIAAGQAATALLTTHRRKPPGQRPGVAARGEPTGSGGKSLLSSDA
jgi:MFS transporter, DHA3 family, macrolide efflux protein